MWGRTRGQGLTLSHKSGGKVLKKSEDVGWGLSCTSHKTWGEGLEEVTRLGARSWRSHNMGVVVGSAVNVAGRVQSVTNVWRLYDKTSAEMRGINLWSYVRNQVCVSELLDGVVWSVWLHMVSCSIQMSCVYSSKMFTTDFVQALPKFLNGVM